MKRTISAILAVLCVLALTLTFTSCATMNKYERNLEKADYSIESLSDSDIEDLFDEIDLDADDYGVKKVIYAMNDEWDIVMIIKCRSIIDAYKLKIELEDVNGSVADMIQVKGSYCFVGSDDAIADALGK